MNDENLDERASADAALEREIRQGRKFTQHEAIGRLAGPGAMKGASPVSAVEQAQIAIGSWLRTNVTDVAGALQAVLHRHLKDSELLLANLDQPLVALADYCGRILASPHRLEEFVREVDVEWGQRMDQRPHFERDGSPPHPDDPYTAASVGKTLNDIPKQLAHSSAD
jgi:hypothetical protein